VAKRGVPFVPHAARFVPELGPARQLECHSVILAFETDIERGSRLHQVGDLAQVLQVLVSARYRRFAEFTHRDNRGCGSEYDWSSACRARYFDGAHFARLLHTPALEIQANIAGDSTVNSIRRLRAQGQLIHLRARCGADPENNKGSPQSPASAGAPEYGMPTAESWNADCSSAECGFGVRSAD